MALLAFSAHASHFALRGSQARSNAAALQRLRALHPGSGDSDAEAAGGDGGGDDAALGPSPESFGAGAGAGDSPEDSRFHDSFTQLPARVSAEPAPFAAPPPGQAAAPVRRRIVPIPLDRPVAAPRAASPEAHAGGGGEDDEELPLFGELPDDKYTDGEEESDEEGSDEGSDEDEGDEDEAADEDEELDIDGSTSGDSESEEAAEEEEAGAAAPAPGRLNRAQRERLEDEAYALQRQEAAAAAGQTNPLAELLASGVALKAGAKHAAGRASDSGAGAESGGDGLRALVAAAGVGTPAPSVTALVEAELALLQATWEQRELPKLQRRAAAFWRQRERFAAEWRNEEAHGKPHRQGCGCSAAQRGARRAAPPMPRAGADGGGSGPATLPDRNC